MPPEARTLHGTTLVLRVFTSMIPPLVLIFLVLGTIFLGVATPTEGGAMGATGALVMALVKRKLSWSLLKQAVNVLLEGTPPHLELGEIEAAMCAVAGVRRVHDLHVWTLTSGREAMSAHVTVEPGTGSDRLLHDLHVLLHARFGIDHTTIQVETEAGLMQITSPAGRPPEA